MRITTDDVLRRIDSRWLGPPGFTFPWSATRYVAYAVGTVIVVLCVLISTRFFGDGFWQIVYALFAGVLITTRIMAHVDDERPASSFLTVLWAEITAPRGNGPHSRPDHIWVDLAGIAVFPITPDGRLCAATSARNRAEHDERSDVQAQTPERRQADHPTAANRGTRRLHQHPGQRMVSAGASPVELSA